MTLTELKESIEDMLGFGVVGIELTPRQMDTAIKKAFREVSPYYTLTEFITVTTQDKIDLSSYNVSYVARVLKIPAADINEDSIIDEESSVDTQSIIDWSEFKVRQQTLDYFREDLSFQYKNKYLYLDDGTPPSGSITIEYVPKISIDTIDSIDDDYYLEMIERFALAFTKQMLGRIRGKYRVSSAPTELDYDALLSESQEELVSAREEIRLSAESFFPE